MQVFSIQEALKFGWHKTKAHNKLVFQVVLTLLAVQVAAAIVQKVLAGSGLGFVAQVVLGVLSLAFGIGAMKIALLLARGEHASYAQIWPSWRLFWYYLGASLLAVLCIIGGLILLIIPGFIIAVRLSMVRFEVIDGAHVKSSLQKSWELTRGHFWKLLGFFITIILLNILGAVCLLVGLLVTIPISMLAFAHVYLKLKNRG